MFAIHLVRVLSHTVCVRPLATISHLYHSPYICLTSCVVPRAGTKKSDFVCTRHIALLQAANVLPHKTVLICYYCGCDASISIRLIKVQTLAQYQFNQFKSTVELFHVEMIVIFVG